MPVCYPERDGSADYLAVKKIHYRSRVQPSFFGEHIGKISKPHTVGSIHLKVPLNGSVPPAACVWNWSLL
jgi:hypothetical protein